MCNFWDPPKKDLQFLKIHDLLNCFLPFFENLATTSVASATPDFLFLFKKYFLRLYRQAFYTKTIQTVLDLNVQHNQNLATYIFYESSKIKLASKNNCC